MDLRLVTVGDFDAAKQCGKGANCNQSVAATCYVIDLTTFLTKINHSAFFPLISDLISLAISKASFKLN